MENGTDTGGTCNDLNSSILPCMSSGVAVVFLILLYCLVCTSVTVAFDTRPKSYYPISVELLCPRLSLLSIVSCGPQPRFFIFIQPPEALLVSPPMLMPTLTLAGIIVFGKVPFLVLL